MVFRAALLCMFIGNQRQPVHPERIGKFLKEQKRKFGGQLYRRSKKILQIESHRVL